MKKDMSTENNVMEDSLYDEDMYGDANDNSASDTPDSDSVGSADDNSLNADFIPDDDFTSQDDFDDLWYNKEGDEDLPEVDSSEFNQDFYYVQDGVYADINTGTVYVEKSIVKYLVKGNSRYYEYNTGKLDSKGNPIIKKLKIKRYKQRSTKKFDIGAFKEENFGIILPYIQDKDVTDINWNGQQLWIDDVNKGRYCTDTVLQKEFVDVMSVRLSNVVSKVFNKYQPYLEAETEELRLTILHESISNTGRAISIRKTPAIKRINFIESIKNGQYCTEEVANLMSNAVKAKMNVIVCGLPGVGKTELIKFLTNYIFPSDRVITIEDTLEIHYDKINPGKDSLVLKISPQFSYTEAIKESLRLLPQWVLLSEARSTEVRYLLESVSTGTKCMTTLHTDDVRKIPDRIVNMIGDINQSDIIKDSVYSFFDMAILIDKDIDPETNVIKRWISQICFFSRENEQNSCTMVVEDGAVTDNKIPQELLKKFRIAGIINPYEYTFIKKG